AARREILSADDGVVDRDLGAVLATVLGAVLAAVADTQEAIALVVADQDRSVRHLEHVDRPAECRRLGCPTTWNAGSRFGEEPLHERFVARHTASIRARNHHAIAARPRAIP